MWGEEFMTSEHAYQWKKYEESAPELAKEILEAPSPSAVKMISDAHKEEVHPDFWEKKLLVMEEILRAKIDQHPRLKEKLMETGEKEIVENSPFDDYWGAGPNGDGENHLGKIWMKIRESLS